MTKQLSKEWFDQRKDRVTGSIAGAILGVNPWMSRRDVLKQKLGYKKFEGNAATQYGSFHEEHALQDFILEHGFKVDEAPFVVHPEHDWLGASPDGFINDTAILEIKCPFGLKDDPAPQFKSIEDQPHYYAQLQIEMFCTGRQMAYFFQWNRFDNKTEIVNFDPDWIEDNFQELYEFYLELKQSENEDDSKLESEFHQAKIDAENAAAKLAEIKDKMIERAKLSGRELIGSVTVAQVERKGAIDYKKVPELKGVDLEPYRKASSKYWKVG